MNSTQTHPQLDVELLHGYLDSLGKNIVEQMFALYRQQVVIYLGDIESAQQADSQELWQESCHKMKGAAASVGFSALHGKLIVIEKNSAEKQEKAELVNCLKQENEHAITAFQQWLEAVA